MLLGLVISMMVCVILFCMALLLVVTLGCAWYYSSRDSKRSVLLFSACSALYVSCHLQTDVAFGASSMIMLACSCLL